MKPTRVSRKYCNVPLLSWKATVNGSLDGNLQDLNGNQRVTSEKARRVIRILAKRT